MAIECGIKVFFQSEERVKTRYSVWPFFIGVELELRHSWKPTNPAKFNSEKTFLSCPCSGEVYWNFG